MKDLLLIPLMIGVFVLGYLLITRLDKFLDENRKAITKREEAEEPSFVMLETELSDDEIKIEIDKFRKKHRKAKIFLYDSNKIQLDFTLNGDSA